MWDQDKKRWVNLDANEDESSGGIPPPPPPRASDLPSAAPAPTPPSVNSLVNNSLVDQPEASSTPNIPPAGPNKYKMSRGKSKFCFYLVGRKLVL